MGVAQRGGVKPPLQIVGAAQRGGIKPTLQIVGAGRGWRGEHASTRILGFCGWEREVAPWEDKRTGKRPIENIIDEAGTDGIFEKVYGGGAKILGIPNDVVVKALLPDTMNGQMTHKDRGVALKRAHHCGKVRGGIAPSKNEVAMIWHETVGINVKEVRQRLFREQANERVDDFRGGEEFPAILRTEGHKVRTTALIRGRRKSIWFTNEGRHCSGGFTPPLLFHDYHRYI